MVRGRVGSIGTGLNRRVATKDFVLADDWRLHIIPVLPTQTMTLIVEDPGVVVQTAVVSEAVARVAEDLLVGASDRLATNLMARSPVIHAKVTGIERRILVMGVQMTVRQTQSRRMTLHKSDTIGRSTLSEKMTSQSKANQFGRQESVRKESTCGAKWKNLRVVLM